MGWYAIRVVPRDGNTEVLGQLRSAVTSAATVERSERPTILLLQAARLSAPLADSVLRTPNVVGFASHPPRVLSEAEFLELCPDAGRDAFEAEGGELDEATLRVLNGPSWARSQRRVGMLMLVLAIAILVAFWSARGG